MEYEDNIYLRLDFLIVLHCGYFQIHMGQLYPKQMYAVTVYQQSVFFIIEYRDSFVTSFILKNL